MFLDKSCCSEPSAYTYLIEFDINGQRIFYYGVRYANIKLGLLPKDDLFEKYFTSSKCVKSLLESGVKPSKLTVHKTFDTYQSACEYEIRFLKRINAKNRKDFLNQTDSFNNAHANNIGRKHSVETRQKVAEASKRNQSSEEYRLKKSKEAKARWSDPCFKEYMSNKLSEFRENNPDFYKTRNQSFKDKTHTDETKRLMSEKMKLAAKKRDFSNAAKKRKKYTCPGCSKIIVAANFDRHTKICIDTVFTKDEKMPMVTENPSQS